MVVPVTVIDPVVLALTVPVALIVNDPPKAALPPVIFIVPSSITATAPLVVIAAGNAIAEVPVNVAAPSRTVFTVNVAPAAFVKPPLSKIKLAVVTALVLNVPELVIKPVNVLVPVLSLSVNEPPAEIVVTPVTANVPLVLTVIEPVPFIVKAPEIVIFPAVVLLNEEPEFILRSDVIVVVPAETVTPPAPSIVSIPEAVILLLKLMAVVANNVFPAPIVAAPPLNVPAELVKPPLKTIFAVVVTAVEVQEPPVFVINPVNVLTPPLFASFTVPAVEVVPFTFIVPVFKLSVAPLATARFPVTVMVNALSVSIPLVPAPIVKDPILCAGETLRVIEFPSAIVTAHVATDVADPGKSEAATQAAPFQTCQVAIVFQLPTATFD